MAVKLAPLDIYDELASVTIVSAQIQPGRGGMTSIVTIDAARVELLLNELRLPGVKAILAEAHRAIDKEGCLPSPSRRTRRARGRRSQPPHRATRRITSSGYISRYPARNAA